MSKKKNGNGTGKWRRPANPNATSEPAQAQQARADGMAEIVPRVVGLVQSRYDSGKPIINCYNVATMLKLPPETTKEIFDGIAQHGGLESSGKGNYAYLKRLDRACAAYVAQSQG
ncbi:hypothetical protein JW707_04295 [Candidatus Woesearchaeota archaeon]|nr:hypothetical protein [Candidatus Woesearchaeota archaeon]